MRRLASAWVMVGLVSVAGCQISTGLGFVCDEQFHCPDPLVCDLTSHCATSCTGEEIAVDGFCVTLDAGRQDAGPPDGGQLDAGRTDAGSPDAGRSDAGLTDAGVLDGGHTDGGRMDAGLPDAGPMDAGLPDAGPPDAGGTDAGRLDSGFPCGTTLCACNGELACVSNECVADTLWTQGAVTPDALPDSEYTVSADQLTVRDSVTGLVWQRTVPAMPCPPQTAGLCAQPGAQTYCANLSLGTYATGWRLPSVVELMSIVSVGTNPLINTTAFPDMPSGYYWTSTVYAPSTANAWDVSFDDGTPSYDALTSIRGVRCVH